MVVHCAPHQDYSVFTQLFFKAVLCIQKWWHSLQKFFYLDLYVFHTGIVPFKVQPSHSQPNQNVLSWEWGLPGCVRTHYTILGDTPCIFFTTKNLWRQISLVTSQITITTILTVPTIGRCLQIEMCTLRETITNQQYHITATADTINEIMHFCFQLMFASLIRESLCSGCPLQTVTITSRYRLWRHCHCQNQNP